MRTIKVAKWKSFRSQLRALHACSDARTWVGHKSLRCAYRTCERGDWMLWLAGRVGVDRNVLVLAACACARLALVHMPAGEGRPLAAIETAERWARGDASVSLEDVRQAAYAAYAAYAAAYANANANAYAYAAYAAANAANAAANAANAANAAANAAAYAAYAANAAARSDTLRNCADIVRRHITLGMIETAMHAKRRTPNHDPVDERAAGRATARVRGHA